MVPFSLKSAYTDGCLEILSRDGERALCRGWRLDDHGSRHSILVVVPATEYPSSSNLERLAHEYGLNDKLDGAWAVRPLELARERGLLVLEDPGGEPLERLLGAPMEVGSFLGLAIDIAVSVGKLHQRGLVHKDIKPANILVNCADGKVRLTGFGLASPFHRERQSPESPETIAGTLAYMAPEQTGRMNRSIDSRSDLYALGITLYQMLTGSLPFTASDPVEWVHCHIARRPVPPAERLKDIPSALSAIIMKLLTKTAEDRYQTAGGLESDLKRCLAAWQVRRAIDDFPLGEHDTPDRLLIPEKLYGREREVETLLASFDRIIKSGAPELVLVSGYSGIGKSSVINELHKALVPPCGLFASGKFDKYRRDIPYATLAQAFQSLVRALLGKSEAELSGWREALREALGLNARLMVDLVPELKLIIGDQPPVSELPPQDAKRRFQLVFRRFIGVFARSEHPLALFLDDLQWLDAATLDLLEDLLTRSELKHLMLIGAYRDNEVTADHPLTRKLDAIKSARVKVQEITLAPLAREHIAQMIADALRCEPTRAALLAQLVHEKTGGNPFFVVHFLYAVVEEGLLGFDHNEARWCWDLKRIQARGFTDNVVDLMVGKLARLPGETQKALQQLACVGNAAETAMLPIIFGTSLEEAHKALWEAVRQQLIDRQESIYQFVHDRVREAAYSLISAQSRAHTHLRIGRLLAARTPPERREEAVFDIVNQLNRGAALITSLHEREQLAQLNLNAGLRARASAAYASALNYFATGEALLADDCWERRHQLAFSFELYRAESEFVTGAVADAEQRLLALATHAANATDHATVARLRVDLYMAQSQPDRAISVGLAYLRQLGVQWSARPSDDDVRREYEHVWSRLGSRAIEDLFDLPLMTNAVALATLDLLMAVMPAAFFTDANLRSLVVLKAVDLSLEWGHSDASCVPYVMFGAIAGARFGDYQAGLRFSHVGTELVERHGFSRVQARTYLNYGNLVLSWTRHLRHARDAFRRAFEVANGSGDVTFAAFSCASLNTNFLAAGDALAEAQREAEYGLRFAEKARFALQVDIMTPQLGLIRMLRGLTRRFGALDHEEFDELRFERRLSANPAFALPESFYWIRKLQARFFAGDYASAVDAASKARRLRWSPPQLFETAEYEFYAALSHAACWDSAPADQRQQHIEALFTHQNQLEVWAQNCPENFADRAALVGAEIARLQGRELDAERLYEQAIRSARESGFIHNEAIAYELAARFYAARGFEEFARVYLRHARDGYVRWGADGKVQQLEDMHPQLREEARPPSPTSIIGASIEHLDLSTVIKMAQTISSETDPEKLVDALLRMAIEQAGAERGLLILVQTNEPRIEALASTVGDSIEVKLCDEPVSASMLPESVLRHVVRTSDIVVLDEAVAQPPFSADPYIIEHRVRSVLCVPLLNRTELTGVLYVENNLSPKVFSAARIAVLKVLASQAAITLENAHLYRDLAEREAKIRCLVDSNVIGIFISTREGEIIEANDAFLKMVEYDREDVTAGRVRLSELTPPEWVETSIRARASIDRTGTVPAFEKEYLRKDGNRVPVLIGSVRLFDSQRHHAITFVLDLTQRKRAEAEARDSESRYREIQLELAHANRLDTMGQLTASIAHEVNQPITGVSATARAALRWLANEPPAVDKARNSLERIVRDADRAGNVIGRIRALVKKAPPRSESFNIGEAIREVGVLTNSEALKNQIVVKTRLSEGLPLVQGDRVQLQQVLLNLIVNAIQAMAAGAGGERDVLITAAPAEPNGVLVAVADSGPGLDPANLEHVFDPFYTTKPEGLGIGLSICRSIIDAHGGRLWVSPNQPRGALFQFTLPTRAAEQS
jgi:PAS domain S-box-containing protein